VAAVVGGVVLPDPVDAGITPATMKGMRRTTELLSQMTIWVGSGSSAPRPANNAANVGMTFHRMTRTTIAAIEMTAIGYVMADLTCDTSLTFFSM
jgi:hypothetical protein